MKFPDKEADILLLAASIQIGLESNATVFPAPPVTAVNLQTALDAFVGAKTGLVAAQAAAKAALDGKNAALDTLVDDMKQILHYAEDKTHNNAAQLQLLGWGVNAAPTPTPPLAPPGQVLGLAAPRQGDGWIFLAWDTPLTGGDVAAYKVQRRLRPDGSWIDVGTAIETGITLNSQERAKEWEYRVNAVNKAGEGEASNTVMAVL